MTAETVDQWLTEMKPIGGLIDSGHLERLGERLFEHFFGDEDAPLASGR